MSNDRFLENYELAEPTLSKLYTSKLRVSILHSVSEKPLSLADLAKTVKSSPPNVSAKLKELEDMCLVEKRDGKYKLTTWGEVTKSQLSRNAEMTAVFEKFKDFWTTHHIDGIPDELLSQIGTLINSNLVRTKDLNVTQAHDSFVKLLNSIKKTFYGISPIYHDEYVEAASMLIHKGVDTQIVVTKDVLNEAIRNLGKGELNFWVKCPNLKFYTTDQDLKVAFTVSDSFTSLALRSKHDKDLYMDMDLQCYEPKAVEWGMKLFEYYKKLAKPANLKEYV